jgi:hypothetical protein
MDDTEQGDVMSSAVPVDAPVSEEIQKAVAEATGEFTERMRSNEEEISKALLRIEDQGDQGGTQEGKPKGWFNDPFSLLDSVGMGYRSNPSSVTYETLRQMVERDTLLSAIVLTRIRQVPRGRDKQYGRQSDEMKARCDKLERFVTNMGVDHNLERDGLSKFMAKVVRDRLTYDQVCFEKVPTYGGKIHSVYAHDASTFRIAQPKNMKGTPLATRSLSSSVQYVQIVNGERVTQYTPQQLAFCIANPRTSLRAQGYGFAEPMMLMNTITAHIWAEDWNRKAFSQGSTIKGVMNLKGNVPRQQYEAFKRQWSAQVAGVNNAWRTPILNSDGVDFTPVQMSNTEMGYQMWIEYLVKIACAIYQMDPTEINFDLRGGSGQQPVFMSSNEAQQEVSKDRGLKPLLRFFQDEFNKHIIHPQDEELEFAFVGLDAKTEEQSIELRQKQSMTTHTINEARALEDLPPIKDGDIINSPTYTGYLQQKAMMDQQGGAPPEGGEGGEEEQQQPYAENMQGAEPGEEEEDAKNKLANLAPDKTLTADDHLKNLHRNDWAASIHASLFDDNDLKKSIDDDLNFDLIDL